MSDVDLGPPLTAAQRQELIAERYRRKGGSRYNEADTAHVAALIAKGATYVQIMERTTFSSLMAAQTFIAVRKLPKPRHALRKGPDIHRMVRDLVATGASLKQIHKAMQAYFPAQSNLYSFLKYHGIPKPRYVRPPRLAQEIVHEIWTLVHKGHSASQIGRMVTPKRTKNAICGIVYGYQLKELKERPEKFVRVLGLHEQWKARRESSYDRSSPDRPVQVAAGLRDAPPSLRPVCSYRGVSLAHV